MYIYISYILYTYTMLIPVRIYKPTYNWGAQHCSALSPVHKWTKRANCELNRHRVQRGPSNSIRWKCCRWFNCSDPQHPQQKTSGELYAKWCSIQKNNMYQVPSIHFWGVAFNVTRFPRLLLVLHLHNGQLNLGITSPTNSLATCRLRWVPGGFLIVEVLLQKCRQPGHGSMEHMNIWCPFEDTYNDGPSKNHGDFRLRSPEAFSQCTWAPSYKSVYQGMSMSEASHSKFFQISAVNPRWKKYLKRPQVSPPAPCVPPPDATTSRQQNREENRGNMRESISKINLRSSRRSTSRI